MSENETYDRACVDQLPEKCHREVKSCCLKPYRNELASCILEENGCCKAHKRAHKSNRGNGDGKDHAERMTVTEIHHTVCTCECKLGHDEEIKDKSDRSHDHQLMKSGEEHAVVKSTDIQ